MIKDVYLNAAFIEITAENSHTGTPYCWNVTQQKIMFAKGSVADEFFNLFVSAPVLFRTLEDSAITLSALNEKLLLKGIDVSDEIDYLITSAIKAQRIATLGLAEFADRDENERGKFK